MKQFFTLLICFVCSTISSAQVFQVETIKLAGDNNNRINIVILSDGYQESELDQFVTDATNFSTELFSQSPFLEYSDYFNVYAIKVPSNESGADHPATATDVTEPLTPIKTVDTYFNSTFDGFGSHRLLFYGIDWPSSNIARSKIISVLADNFPAYDSALILVNSTVYGGSGGEFPMSSMATNANEIAIHELGHSLFDLLDEYYPGDGRLREDINATKESDPSVIKWKNWLGDNGVGIYAYGTSGEAATWNRPHQGCKMRYLGFPFCSVCKEGMVEKIHDLVSPVDDFTPDNSSNIENPTFPLDFELTLIKPNPNTLESIWTLNGTTIGNNVDIISLLATDLMEGTNTLTSIITDNSPMLRVDNHETVHVTTVTWTINYSALSVDVINAKSNSYTISLYPNPTNAILNFKFESNTDTPITVNITSLDGKQSKSLILSNYKSTEINISDFSAGIYVANFYTNNTLIASRKIVKN
ncbi:putative secreted protein (Por secretion system target) [Jejuia pallidilutea]|uniref:Putative secreted protein (Por secretion system target) n=1 Tax=Jejuia pallidilutea TaxID=504487 RepID=A0A362WZT6_9FLAO|nr:M64 family metallopeptidase [Jejuia pallidilutea]PQV48277.1 putative secreted protein (Por secretion system target) [Jejuia pallidilutea]